MYKVLLVEDEAFIRKGLRYVFDWEKEDCIVIDEADNGEVGLIKIKELRPDIVITDIKMPIKDGLEMLSEVVEDSTFVSILLSGYQEFSYAKQAVSLGVVDYLEKPVDFEQLRHVIAKSKTILEMKKSYLSQEEVKVLVPIEPKSVMVEKALSYIHAHYMEKITMQILCNECGCGATTLHNRFKKELNMTYVEYVNRYRISIALQYLQTTKYTISDIASLCGFADYAYFYDVFLKYVGYPVSKMKNFRKI